MLSRNSFLRAEIASRYLFNLRLTNRNKKLGSLLLADSVRKQLSIFRFSLGLPKWSLMFIKTIPKLMQMLIPPRCSKI